MTSFYTNVKVLGNSIAYRGIRNGKRVIQRISYRPTLYVPSKKPSTHKTLKGDFVEPFGAGDIKESKDFLKRYEGVDNFDIFGMTKFEYAFIADSFPGDIDFDQSLISISPLDIEVASENGYALPDDPREEVTAITMMINDIYHTFGCGEYPASDRNDIKHQYHKCKNEIDLLQNFLDLWTHNYPDIVTGWNVNGYDIPYLINRITRILGEREAMRLSPWGRITNRKVFMFNKEQTFYEIFGIGILDYIDLYKKFAKKGNQRESYKLNDIANIEIGEKKISYDEFASLQDLYKNNYPKFIEYNVHDTVLISKLDNKLGLLALALTLAYNAKCNFEDVFRQTRMWDTIIYNNLKEKNIVIPQIKQTIKNKAYAGAFVKEPKTGFYHWIVSFDLTSLYPHLIMQYNLSPEMLIEPEQYTKEMKDFLAQDISVESLLTRKVDTSALQIIGATVTPNRQLFRTDQGQGFLAEIMEKMFTKRQVAKNKMLDLKKTYETLKDGSDKTEITKQISKYENLQESLKICLNSAYGSIGNEFFRFYDVRIAEAVTLAGQLSAKWIEQEINKYMNNLLKTVSVDYVIASDTDSIYLNMESLVNAVYPSSPNPVDPVKVIDLIDKICKSKIQPFINDRYDELAKYTNAYAQKMLMKREILADKGIWTGKKHYILNVYDKEGVRYAKPKLEIKGIESVKSSTPMACRKMIEETIKIIMNGTEDDVITAIDTFREEFNKLPPEDIAFPRGLNGLNLYRGLGLDSHTIATKGTPIHVKGALVYNFFLKQLGLEKKYITIVDGDKIKFLNLKEPNPFMSHVIAFSGRIPEEFKLTPYVDYNTQFEKAYLEPIKAILDVIGWKVERTASIMDFFT